jgi:hypothetical protein
MKIEQAVFASAANPANHGYQLVARSLAITDELAQQLCRWGPSHGSLVDEGPGAESLNYAVLDHGLLAVSRSVFGGPEPSLRGSLQIVTRTLVFPSSLLSGYDHNPWRVLRTALTLGFLRLYCGGDSSLPSISFPDTSLIGCESHRPPHSTAMESSIAEACQMLLFEHSVAILGALDMHHVLSRIMKYVPPRDRSRISFTTGLRPCVHRPFRVHLLSRVSPELAFQMSKLGISSVSIPSS